MFMVDEETDKAIVLLNMRYQKLLSSAVQAKNSRRKFWLRCIKNLDLKSIFEAIVAKFIIRSHSCLKGNNYIIEKKIDNQLDITNKKIAVYCCIIGKYDNVYEPIYHEPGIDYYMFTDLDLPADSKWHKIDIKNFAEYKIMSPYMLNRKIKMLPYLYLPNYDYSLYVDGSIEIAAPISPLIKEMGHTGLALHFHNQRDCIYDEYWAVKYKKKADPKVMKLQLDNYRNAGFPKHWGLFENTILIRNHHNIAIESLMQRWWLEYNNYPTRDQLSLPYLVWKMGLKFNDICILGNNLSMNPRFNRKQHV